MTEPKRIFIKMSNWVGDFIMNLTPAEILRRAYPEAEITWVARPYLREIARFRTDLFDDFIDFRDKKENWNFFDLFRFGRSLRSASFSHAFLFTRHFKGAWVAKSAGIPERVGFSIPYFSWLLTHTKSLPRRNYRSLHDIQENLSLLESYGIDVTSPPNPKLIVGQDEANTVFQKYLAGSPSPRLFIHAGSSGSMAKRWTVGGFHGVAERFLQETQGSVFLLGVGSERALNQAIANGLPETKVHNLAGETTLWEAIALVAQASMLVSNDSGFMHVANSLAIPHVTIFGPTDPRLVLPGEGKRAAIQKDVECGPCHLRQCPYPEHPCMTTVTAEQVWEEGLRHLLKV